MSTLLGHEHVFSRFRSEYSQEVSTFLRRQMEQCRTSGIGDIVDVTAYANPARHVRLLQQGGPRIWSCVGFYLEDSVATHLRGAHVERLTRYLLEAFHKRNPHAPVACVKFAARHPVWTSFEQRAATACVLAANELSLPLVTHSPHGGLEHLTQLKRLGMEPTRIAISHPEFELKGRYARPPSEVKARIQEIFREGGWACITDLYGQFSRSDSRTISLIEQLIRLGEADRIFISSDASWKLKRGQPVFQGTGGADGFVTCLAAADKLRHRLGDAPEIGWLWDRNPRQFYEITDTSVA